MLQRNLPKSAAQAEPPVTVKQLLDPAAKIAIIAVAGLAFVAALHFGRTLLLPVSMAVVIGLMFGPYADRLEKLGMRPAASAVMVVFTFLLLIAAVGGAFAVPLSEWSRKLPVIWERIRETVGEWQGVVETAAAIGDQVSNLGEEEGGVTVKVDEGNPAKQIAFLAPELMAQLVVFLASLYFFVSSRHGIRVLILRLCLTRRLRWRMAHVFKDVEGLVSRYLVSITLINMTLGAVVASAMYLVGVPSPLLWGLLATVLNYAIYIGPAAMALILLGVGFATFTEPGWILAPMVVYLCINLTEAQFVTPHVLGQQLTMNPFLVFLAVLFWLWVWGPAGGFVAVPFLIIMTAILGTVFPAPPQHQRKNPASG
ncbi:AI-2E family transporter [Salaquimonas pukyongi]|uniref:AI-2E family transporter n=1 Tax=Salaquimonas pukyongi TaxID=2712698 RepID=UPI00096BC9AC|nr:AI-2E family transporter [Salaquimonas pukyongi]